MKNGNQTQIIHDAKGAPVAVVLPWREYEKLRKGPARDDSDAELIRVAARHRGEESFPAEVANRLIDGETPLKVIREWRKLSQSQLAEKTGVASQYISQVERRDGGRKLGRKTAQKLAEELGVSFDLLMDL